MKAVIYDFRNLPTECDLGDKPIKWILVEVVSRDEILVVCYKDGTKKYYDSSYSRCMDFRDGMYLIDDENGIEKWLKWEPKDKTKTISHARGRDFKKYEVFC